MADCLEAADRLKNEGLDVGVINARFVKPLDVGVLQRALGECRFLVTVEEAQLTGGFGSAVLEAASEMRLDTNRIHRLGLPDRFAEHGERGELLSDLGLDAAGIAQTRIKKKLRACVSDSALADIIQRARSMIGNCIASRTIEIRADRHNARQRMDRTSPISPAPAACAVGAVVPILRQLKPKKMKLKIVVPVATATRK